MLREVREVVPHDPEALVVVGDLEVGDAADLRVHRGAAHLLLGDVLADRGLHQVAAAERHRRRALHHRHEVGERGDVRGAGRAVTDHRGDHRHDAAHRDLLAEQVAGAGERRAARRLDARAGGVEQPDHRDALAEREVAQPADLVLADRAHRAGHHGEVVRRDRDLATVDLADAGDRAVGREVPVAEAGVHVVGEHPVLDPGARDRAAGRGARARGACRASAGARRTSRRPCPSARSRRLREVADERAPVVHVSATGGSHGVTLALNERYRPFHSGVRFSANAATPSAASSDCVWTVSIPCR